MLWLFCPEVEFVAIHDAVRPCIMEEQITAVFQKAQETGRPSWLFRRRHLKQVDSAGQIQATMPRRGLWRRKLRRFFGVIGWWKRMLARTAELGHYGRRSADGSGGHPVTVVEGSPSISKSPPSTIFSWPRRAEIAAETQDATTISSVCRGGDVGWKRFVRQVDGA